MSLILKKSCSTSIDQSIGYKLHDLFKLHTRDGHTLLTIIPTPPNFNTTLEIQQNSIVGSVLLVFVKIGLAQQLVGFVASAFYVVLLLRASALCKWSSPLHISNIQPHFQPFNTREQQALLMVDFVKCAHMMSLEGVHTWQNLVILLV